MWLVSLYALAAIVQSALGDGGKSLYIAIAALAAALLTEFLIGWKARRFTILDGSAAASALVLTLLLPNQISPFFAAFGAVFAVAVVKISFGGLGANWLNPAVSAWLLIRFSWPEIFGTLTSVFPFSFIEPANAGIGGYETGSVWGTLTQNGFVTNENTITAALNDTVLSVFNMELPAKFFDFFASPGPGIIGDRGVYALLIGSILIISLDVSRFSVSACYLAVYLFLIRFAGGLPGGGAFWEGDIFFGLFTGGTLIGAFLLLTEPATGPKSGFGKISFAVAAALFSFFFRYMKNEPYGAFFAVALLNVLSPLVRSIESRCIYGGHDKQ
jgi:electron transport complex protein RnfD